MLTLSLHQDTGGVACMVSRTSTANPTSLNGDGHPTLSRTTDNSPLLQNYEMADGVSLPRSAV
jgi:hypothetical protein